MVPMMPKTCIFGKFQLSTCYSFSSNNNLPLEKVLMYLHPWFLRKFSDSRMCPCNKGDMEGHHTDESITCLLWLHDDFADFSSISLIFSQWLA